jgi:hypothetical protein
MTLFDLRFLAVMNFQPPWPSDCILFLLVKSAMSREACESVSPNMVFQNIIDKLNRLSVLCEKVSAK